MSDHYYTPEELDGLDKADLETVVEARGLDVKGSGKGGTAVVKDLVAAITADQDARGLNPALEPAVASDDPVKRKYQVTGPRRVRGVAKPKTFTAVLSPGEEAALIAAGHITAVQEG